MVTRLSGFIPPILLSSARQLPVGDKWQYEVKWDGYRCIAVKDGSRVILFSRNGHNLTARFPSVAQHISELPVRSTVLDGELVALDHHGKPSFRLMRGSGGCTPVYRYFGFDLLRLGGRSLVSRELVERRERLSELLSGSDVNFSRTLDGDAQAVLRAVQEHQLEGIVAKRRHSKYTAGKRNPAWVKFRVGQQHEFLVGGVIGEMEALIVGQFEGRRFHYAGKVRGGLVKEARETLAARLAKLATKRRFFDSIPMAKDSSWGEGRTEDETQSCQWFKPAVRVFIKFASWEATGLRHAHLIS